MLAPEKNTRGSIMIAALIITLITGSLVGLFLKTVTQEVANTHRARMGFQAINIAEAGVEYAMHAMIQKDWDSWTNGTKGYFRNSFRHIDISSDAKAGTESTLEWLKNRGGLRNDTRSLRVYVEPEFINAAGKKVPVTISEGQVRLNNGMLVVRQIRVEMEKGSDLPWKRGWGNGVLGKDSVEFKGGNVQIDSYFSSLGPYDVLTNRLDGGSVASNAVVVGAVSVGNADVIGRVATGGGKPDVGPRGSIRSLLQSQGTVDLDRVALDFYADLPDPIAPSFTAPLTTYSGTTIGTDGLDTEYKLSAIDVDSSDVLTIEGNVVMVVTGDFIVKGEIQIAEGASLELYVEGDIDVGGNGIINLTNSPPNLLVYNTGRNNEVFIHGNGAFSGAVYAPNSAIELKGAGTAGVFYGAVVGETVFFNGNYEFHYDEDLANINPDDDDDGRYVPVVTGWRELNYGGERISDWDALVKNGL